ncbi:DNA N-glycosylase and apurinic/apyrimidinic (AP) lyase [Rhizophlyctis rosea]|nr:DNA N-glycosylase and apurinic/apyrimidinic (AP) lyase [Rhizophlyctis rosea]
MDIRKPLRATKPHLSPNSLAKLDHSSPSPSPSPTERKLPISTLTAQTLTSVPLPTPPASPKEEDVKKELVERDVKVKAEVEVKAELEDMEDIVRPPKWREVWAAIKEYRDTHPADVDTMGCALQADTTASPRDQRFQTLVALLISASTKDKQLHPVMNELKAYESPPGTHIGLNLESILAMDAGKLEEFVRPSGLGPTKTRNIRAAAVTCLEKFDGDIPRTVKGLESLLGVGPKMSRLAMQFAWGEVAGIAVDTHVHCIANRLGWVKTTNEKKTGEALESWLPKEPYWGELNKLWVGFGQILCDSRIKSVQDCSKWECPLVDLCPKVGVPGTKGKTKAGKKEKPKEEVFKAEMEVKREWRKRKVEVKDEDEDGEFDVGMEVKRERKKRKVVVKEEVEEGGRASPGNAAHGSNAGAGLRTRACQECRERKRKCDKEFPMCSECFEDRTVRGYKPKCVYPEEKTSGTAAKRSVKVEVVQEEVKEEIKVKGEDVGKEGDVRTMGGGSQSRQSRKRKVEVKMEEVEKINGIPYVDGVAMVETRTSKRAKAAVTYTVY